MFIAAHKNTFANYCRFPNLQKERFFRKYTFIALFVGMMIRNYYENELTSLVTVSQPEKVFASFKDLFDDEYRFYWFKNCSLEVINRLNKSINIFEIL